MKTVPSRIEFFANKYPDKEVFVFYNTTERVAFTWKQVYELASRFASRLQKQGFKRHDVIANTLPNSPERLISDLGINFAGCTTLNGQILLADGDDFFESARVSRCKAVVVCPRDEQPAWKLLRPYIEDTTSETFAKVNFERAPDLTSAILVSRDTSDLGCHLLKELECDSCKGYVAEIDQDDVQHVFTTSGSTGYSKLVPRTHEWLMDGFSQYFGGLEPGSYPLDDVYTDRPLGWLGGFPLLTLQQGQKRVLLDSLHESLSNKGRAALAWETIVKEKCAQIAFSLLDFYHMRDYVRSKGGPVHKVKLAGTGSQPITKKQVVDMFELCDNVIISYGSTETGIVSMVYLTEPNDYNDYKSGTMFHTPKENIRIVTKDGTECKTGDVGLINVKGKSVFSGYFNKVDDSDEQTKKAFTADGWYNTEDNGFMDEAGHLYVIGREKDIIMYGSHVVYPGWLERKIKEHADIAEALVVPVSDPILFNNICACVQPLANKTVTVEGLKEFADSIFLTNGEDDATPAPKFYMILEEMPMTASGKPDKQLIKKMAEERFGLVKN